MTENNKTILREFMDEVWNKGNLDAADKFIAFPYVIHSDPGDQWEGQSLDLPLRRDNRKKMSKNNPLSSPPIKTVMPIPQGRIFETLN